MKQSSKLQTATGKPASKPKISRNRRFLRWGLEGIFVIGVLIAVQLYQTRGVVRGQAPDFEGRLLNGATVSLDEFRGRPVLLQFWASWCPVCSLEQGSIHAIAQDHAVLSVAQDDASAEEIRQWMENKEVSYPVIRDPSGHISSKFGVRGLPTSVIIDALGEIRFIEVGYTTELGLRLRLWWVGL